MNILEYLMNEKGINLEKRGDEFWACCPIHQENTPSFSIRPSPGGRWVWYCFGCNNGGNDISLIMQLEGVKRQEASKILGLESLISYDQNLLGDIVDGIKIDPNHSFLKDRGISPKVAQRYSIGYCSDWGDIVEKFKLKSDDILRLGLYDLTNQIVYPFFNSNGGCYKVHSRRANSKNYLCKEGLGPGLWQKALWGLNHVRSEHVYIFEGFQDVLVAATHGIQSVAMCGTNMYKNYWVQLRKNGVTKATIVPDGDAGGEQALKKILQKGVPEDFDVNIICLPHGDPDDYIIREEFKGLPPKTLLEWYVGKKWRHIKKDSPIHEIISMFKDIAKYLGKMPPYQRKIFEQRFSDRYGGEAITYLDDEAKPDINLEKAVIANALFDEDSRALCLLELREDYFYDEIHRKIFKGLGKGLTRLEVEGYNDLYGFETHIDTSNNREYVRSLKKTAIRIELKDAINRTKTNGDPIVTIGSLIDRLSRLCSESYIPAADTRKLIENTVSGILDETQNPIPFPIGPKFPALNEHLFGFPPNTIIIISGLTNTGKTTFVCNLIEESVFRGVSTLFVTVEMSPREILTKLIAIRTRINPTRIRKRNLIGFEREAIQRVGNNLKESDCLKIEWNSDMSHLLTAIRGMIIKYKINIIIFDYLQLFTLNSRESRWEQLSSMTQRIKTDLCTLGPTCIVVSALNKDKTMLAGSHASGFDADVILELDAKELPDEDGSNLSVIVKKDRNNHAGIEFPMVFDRSTMTIMEVKNDPFTCSHRI
jgi:replicative DNA helicase